MSTQNGAVTAPTARKLDMVSYLMSQMRTVGLLVAFIVIILLMQTLTGGMLLTPQNITSILTGNAYILILAIGMVMVIIAGHIDLSVGSVVALIGALTGWMITYAEFPWWLAIILGIAAGAMIGAWQGFWIAYVGIPAFIVTLGGMLTFRGLAQMVLGNVPITPFPSEYVAIGAGFLPDLGPGLVLEPLTIAAGLLGMGALIYLQLRSRAARKKLFLDVEPFGWFVAKMIFIAGFITAISLLLASYKGLPIVVVILLCLVVVYTMVMNSTVFGRNIYARGGNLHAAQLSGVNTKKVDFLLFVNMGVLGAIAFDIFNKTRAGRSK